MSAARAALGWLAIVLGACGPATDRATPVSAGIAPLWASTDGGAPIALHAGDLVEVTGEAGEARFAGELAGLKLERVGSAARVRRSTDEAPALAFRADLGPQTQAPTAAWICAAIHGGPSCAARLHRVRYTDGYFAWERCPEGACQVALVRGRRVAAMAMTGVREAQVVQVGGADVALVECQVPSEPGMRQTELYTLRMSAPLRRGLRIPLEQRDYRGSIRTERSGYVVVEGDALVFRGLKEITATALGQTMYRDPIVERYQLAR